MKRSILIALVVVAACTGGVLGSLITIRYFGSSIASYTSIDDHQKLQLTNYRPDTSYSIPEGLDFLKAARAVTPSVVHIRTSYGAGEFSMNPLQFYFDKPARSSGSGVVVSDDGYIVTNNHVIAEATNIEVVMNNNQRYFAKLVGADETTDLALLKIQAHGLPFVRYGNSDSVSPGEWVLAIGNPFDLNSTVTAGIVSAKARNIGILRDRNNLQVESFIQTDAAVNPGNSGGALVNLNGDLIGINTAIATSNGTYQGYSFAIPVSLVKKVADDLLEFGQVQRGLLGIEIADVNARVAEDLGLVTNQGVLVRRVNKASAAEKAGILAGDVIVGIEHNTVNSVSELQEYVARHRPGKEITVTYIRNGERKVTTSKLRNYAGTSEVVAREVVYTLMGATFEDVPFGELSGLELEGGVRITDVENGKWKDAGFIEGFVIAYIDKIPVENVADLNRILEFKRGGILVEGFFADGEKGTIGLDW
ncbi:MAG TPA: trypsin-like peptidase domain-containing protein [Cyclobacteriaceae bacterium]